MQTLVDQSIDQAEHDALVVPAPDLSWLPGCSPADLLENAAGRLSGEQGQDLKEDLAFHLIWAGLASAPFLIGAIASGNFVMAIFACLIVGTMGWGCVQRLREVNAGKVAIAEGAAWTELIRGGEDPDQYWLYIDGLELATDKRLHQAFQPGGPYRVFYLPVTETVVAAVPLPGWRYNGWLHTQMKRRPWWSNISIDFGG